MTLLLSALTDLALSDLLGPLDGDGRAFEADGGAFDGKEGALVGDD